MRYVQTAAVTIHAALMVSPREMAIQAMAPAPRAATSAHPIRARDFGIRKSDVPAGDGQSRADTLFFRREAIRSCLRTGCALRDRGVSSSHFRPDPPAGP